MKKKMAIRNKIKYLVDQTGITRYQFWKDTGLAQNTAYRLYDDPTYIPGEPVMEKICSRYGWQPGDYIIYIPNEHLPNDEGDEKSTGYDDQQPASSKIKNGHSAYKAACRIISLPMKRWTA